MRMFGDLVRDEDGRSSSVTKWLKQSFRLNIIMRAAISNQQPSTGSESCRRSGGPCIALSFSSMGERALSSRLWWNLQVKWLDQSHAPSCMQFLQWYTFWLTPCAAKSEEGMTVFLHAVFQQKSPLYGTWIGHSSSPSAKKWVACHVAKKFWSKLITCWSHDTAPFIIKLSLVDRWFAVDHISTTSNFKQYSSNLYVKIS